LSGTPINSHVGWFWVNVSVTDGNGGLDFINYTITVSNVNDAPQITTSDVITATEDILYSVDYEAIDIDPTQDILIWTLQTNASWLALNTTTGVLSGTPTNWDIGYYWVNVSVSDGKGGFDYTNFSLNVNEENDPPQIISSDIEFALEDSYYETDYNFTDIDDPSVTWLLNTNASWLSINPSTGILNGTPDNSHVGWFWVNVTVDDGRGGIDFTNFTVTVNNTSPFITTIFDEFVNEDQLHWDDFDCDDDTQGNITYSLSTNASWLSIDSLTGELNGTANNTQVGWYWVNVTVDDGNGGFDYVYYTVTVNNSIPTITTSPATNAYEDSEYLQDFDCEDDGQGTIFYSLETNALWLSIDTITGIINGTPQNDNIGLM
jgi:archaellin